MIATSECSKIADFLDRLNIESYQFDNNSIDIHLPHLQKMDGVTDAKISCIDNVIVMQIISEIKLSAILTLMSELSQINETTFFVKTFLDIKENQSPRIIFSYSMHNCDELDFNQFSLALASVEEESLQIISELILCELLNNEINFSSKNQDRGSSLLH